MLLVVGGIRVIERDSEGGEVGYMVGGECEIVVIEDLERGEEMMFCKGVYMVEGDMMVGGEEWERVGGEVVVVYGGFFGINGEGDNGIERMGEGDLMGDGV